MSLEKIREMGEGIMEIWEVMGGQNVKGIGNENLITGLGKGLPRNVEA